MAFVKIPEELLSADITATQFRILAILINNSFDDGYSYLGYTKLAELCRTQKGAMISHIKQLEELGYIEKTKRGAFNRSNSLRLTLTNGLNKCRQSSGENTGGTIENIQQGSLNRTPEGSLNRTPEGSLNRTEGSLNRTEGSLNRTPHIDLKFKYPDLNTQKNARTREQGSLNRTPSEAAEDNQIAPADGAAGRSMPIQESAKEVRAEAPAANIDATALWRECQAEFTGIAADVVFGQAGNRYFLRKKSKFTLAGHIRALEVADWLAARGLSAEVLGDNVHYSQETIIGEAV